MPPVVIAAGIGAAAGIGGGLLSASAQKKAAGKAADSAANTAAQNNALQSQIYGQNQAILNPYVQRGNAAGDAINSLLGLGGTSPPPTSPGYGGGMAPANSNPVATTAMSAINSLGTMAGGIPFRSPEFSAEPTAQIGQVWGGYNPGLEVPVGMQLPPSQAAPTGTVQAAPTAQNAFQNYLGSTGYQFQIDQGNKGINQGYAARGSLQSGAAMKALQTYGQNTATGFFKDYLGLLSNQQGVGLSGASAVAGVGQNYANTVSANNNASGTAQQNALLAAGNANANMWGNVAGGIAGVANAYGSSYRR